MPQKNKLKKILSTVKPYDGEFSSLQEKIVSRLNSLALSPEMFNHAEPNEYHSELILNPVVQREISRQKIFLLSEILIANK